MVVVRDVGENHLQGSRACSSDTLCSPTLRAGGGQVHVFSGMHASGEQLNQLSGIAAVLRFPLPDLEEQEFEAEW